MNANMLFASKTHHGRWRMSRNIPGGCVAKSVLQTRALNLEKHESAYSSFVTEVQL